MGWANDTGYNICIRYALSDASGPRDGGGCLYTIYMYCLHGPGTNKRTCLIFIASQ